MKPKTKHAHLLHTIEPPLPTGVRHYCLLCGELCHLLNDAYEYTDQQRADMALIGRIRGAPANELKSFVNTLSGDEKARLAEMTKR